MAVGDVPVWLQRYVDEGCCWVWTGPVAVKYTRRGPVYRAVVGVPGAGTTNAARAMHRAVYGVVLGPGWKVRHTCDQPMCVNPAHLIAGTSRANTADAQARRRLAPSGQESQDRVEDCCAELVHRLRPQGTVRVARPQPVHKMSTIPHPF